MRPIIPGTPRATFVLGVAAFLLIGWNGLLVPSLIRSIEHDFGQTDAGIGAYYFVSAIAYVIGSMGGGVLTERLGRRVVLGAALGLMGLGGIALASTPLWAVVLAAAIPIGLGQGAVDGGVNGLFLDVFAASRGRALNLLHVFFAIGALASPFIVGRLVEGGVGWQPIIAGTGVVAIGLAAIVGSTGLASGRHIAGESQATLKVGIALPLVALAVGIGCYVASEIGISNWLVRFLDAAPLGVATGALSLFWAGLMVGRLIGARLADRFDHTALAIASAAVSSIALVLAVVAPSLPLQVALFAVVGLGSGPIYPMIMAVAGERYPERSAAVGGFLAGTAVIGSIVYPPLMGFLSVTVGLPIAMLGTAMLGFGCIAALVVARSAARAGAAAPA